MYALEEVLVRLAHRLLPAALFTLIATILASAPAAAHTGFDSSIPTDGAVLDSPVSEIVLVFTGPAEPTGAGFEVLDATGQPRTPTEATSENGQSWLLRFEPPLGAGVVGVRWMITAPDSHPVSGTFSFTVANTLDNPQDAGSQPSTSPETAPATTGLNDFLDQTRKPTALASRFAAAARVVTLAGTLLGVGALAFAGLVLRGERRDVRHVLFWIRRSGLLVSAGAIAELIAQAAIDAGGAWSASWSLIAIRNVIASSFGVAVVLRVAGGAALTAGARLDHQPAARSNDPINAVRQLVGAGRSPSGSSHATLDHFEQRHPPLGEHPLDQAWRPETSWLALAGAVAVVAAHLFDGHTVMKGNRFWTGVADVVHVLAGSVWLGGVAMLAAVLWQRHRHGRPPRALHLALRFSVVATIALVGVAVAGLALTIIVLDSPSELWRTEWGRTLLAKTFLVAVAAAGGAYNHQVIIPELVASPGDNALMVRFRIVVTCEAFALAAVLAATALLMGAAS